MGPSEDEERRRRSEAITNAVRSYGHPSTANHPAARGRTPGDATAAGESGDYRDRDDAALVASAEISYRRGEPADWALVRELCRRLSGAAR